MEWLGVGVSPEQSAVDPTDPDGEPNPSHGLNPVPFILISDEPGLRNAELRQGQGLSSVAPTILQLLGLEAPPEMTGESLIVDG